ncbi:hypothetical protein RchiOBHm_Chr2g0130401 [Rosa chinensis]|uniref:Uncharacterized protein n=1 Tax=Rosa chinensis TaxID=74649 RepID=A0A2P6RUT3_ROSCH|nr:hypothetical protein RchiOBHm_Chr2g0130401 [Rosa chinensis]
MGLDSGVRRCSSLRSSQCGWLLMRERRRGFCLWRVVRQKHAASARLQCFLT